MLLIESEIDMKNNKFGFKSALAVFALVFASVTASAQEYTLIKRLGTNEAVCSAGIESAEELQSFFANDAATVAQILQDANWQGDQADLEAEIAAGNFTEKSYAPGSRFHWMAARKKGNGVALPNREWAGDEDFIGYEVNVTSQCQVHTMVIPKICCNLSLLAAEPVAVAEPNVIVSNSDSVVTVCTEPGNQLMVISPDGTSRNIDADSNGCWSGELQPGEYQFKASNLLCGGADTVKEFNLAAAVIPPPVVDDAPDAPVQKSLIPFVGMFLVPKPEIG